jgi:hypothetical protein
MKKLCICTHTLIQVRLEPSERAELITQLLFGETFKVIELTGNWARIITVFDAYEGWIDKKLITELSENSSKQLEGNVFICNKTFASLHNISKKCDIPLVAGSVLPIINELDEFAIEQTKYRYSGKLENLALTNENVIMLAQQFLNAPYLWGGRTVLGIDCSGLTQLVYKLLGVALFRDASMQVNQGRLIEFLAEARPGDLAFFENNEGKIIHVGILLNKHQIIHCSGWVKIESIDHQGIFNTDLQNYSHALRLIKRIIN